MQHVARVGQEQHVEDEREQAQLNQRCGNLLVASEQALLEKREYAAALARRAERKSLPSLWQESCDVRRPAHVPSLVIVQSWCLEVQVRVRDRFGLR